MLKLNEMGFLNRLTPVQRVLIFSAILAVVIGYVSYQSLFDVKPGPCSAHGIPARCYHISQRSCETTWNKAEGTCKEMIQKLNLPPGRLLGPLEEKCKTAILDEAFAQSRRSTPECQDMFTELEDWKRRNDFH